MKRKTDLIFILGSLCLLGACQSLNGLLSGSLLSPLPAGYPRPEGAMQCAAGLYRGTLDISARQIDLYSPEGWLQEEGLGGAYNLLLVEERFPAGESMLLALPSLQPGTYLANRASLVQEPSTLLTYSWSRGLSESSYDEGSEVKITLEGNQGGWVWGKYSGRVGRATGRTILSGNFACRHASL